MTEKELALLGKSYKNADKSKLIVHQIASKIAGNTLPIEDTHNKMRPSLEKMSDFSLGVMLMLDWGVTVPDDLVSKAGFHKVVKTPGTLEIH